MVQISYKNGSSAAEQAKKLTTSSGQQLACRCAICECGKHRCPPQATLNNHYDPSELQSTYAKQYPQHPLCQIHKHVPTHELHVEGKVFDGQSTHRLDFNKKEGAKPSTPFKPDLFSGGGVTGRVGEPDEREFTTENKKYFSERGAPSEKAKPLTNQIVNENHKFDGTSTYAATIASVKGGKPSTPFKPDLFSGNGVTGRVGEKDDREFKSHTQQVHSGVRGIPAVAYKPDLFSGSAIRGDVPFDATTTYGSTHHELTGAKPSTPFIPAKYVPAKEEETRDFATTSRSNGNDGKGVHVRESYKPKIATHVQGLPFDGQTTHKEVYSAKGGKPATPFKPDLFSGNGVTGRVGEADDREWNTENKQYFSQTGRPSEKAKPLPNQIINENHKFDGTSTYAATIAAVKGGKPSTPFKPDLFSGNGVTGRVGEKDDREFKSHTQQVHSGVRGERTQPFKPDLWSGSAIRGDAPFDATTTHASTFKRHELSRCPAAHLNNETAQLDNGHLIYEKSSSNEWSATSRNQLPIVQ